MHLLSILRTELKALGMLGKCPTTELHTQSQGQCIMEFSSRFVISPCLTSLWTLLVLVSSLHICICYSCKLIKATHNSRAEHIMFGEVMVTGT